MAGATELRYRNTDQTAQVVARALGFPRTPTADVLHERISRYPAAMSGRIEVLTANDLADGGADLVWRVAGRDGLDPSFLSEPGTVHACYQVHVDPVGRITDDPDRIRCPANAEPRNPPSPHIVRSPGPSQACHSGSGDCPGG